VITRSVVGIAKEAVRITLDLSFCVHLPSLASASSAPAQVGVGVCKALRVTDGEDIRWRTLRAQREMLSIEVELSLMPREGGPFPCVGGLVARSNYGRNWRARRCNCQTSADWRRGAPRVLVLRARPGAEHTDPANTSRKRYGLAMAKGPPSVNVTSSPRTFHVVSRFTSRPAPYNSESCALSAHARNGEPKCP
jgi:hypothetical protein